MDSVPLLSAAQKRGNMKSWRKKIITMSGILGVILFAVNASRPVYAAQEGSLITGNPNAQDTAVFTYEEDGLVDGKKEFIIPAAAGENFEIEITFAGNGADGVMSFAYDNVTEDQMVPNTNSTANDRSGLLNETVKEGQPQTRSFRAAAIDGNIVITATGNGKVLSIKAVKQAAKTPNEKACVYTIGDSLVQTYAANYAPQTGWGQTLPLYFDANVTFINRALGGRSTGNYMRQGRLNEVLCEIAPGDCVLIEFGHNDASSGNKDRYVSVADYKKLLADVYIKGIRDRGATPILVTLCNRNQYYYTTGEFTVSFPEYVEAMRETAAETDTLLIDLNAITVDRFTKLGQQMGAGVTNDIIYNHAIAGAYEGEYAKGVSDNTHLQYYGAKLVGGFVAEELQKLNLQGISEHYVPLEIPKIPKTPEGITEKKFENYVSRITWTPCEGADYYKILMAEIVEKNIHGDTAASGDTAGGDSVAVEDDTAPAIYELAGEFEVAGYTAVCDFANKGAAKDNRYAYKVIAVNAAGESPESEIFSFGLQLSSKDKTESDSSEPSEVHPELNSPEPSETQPKQDSAISSPAFWAIAGILAAALLLAGILAWKKSRNH